MIRLGPRLAWFLLGVAAWNVITYATFIRNLAGTEGRPAGFYIAHIVLIVVNLAIAGVLGTVGVRALRARYSARNNTPGTDVDAMSDRPGGTDGSTGPQ